MPSRRGIISRAATRDAGMKASETGETAREQGCPTLTGRRVAAVRCDR
jgi:hypothetical protein